MTTEEVAELSLAEQAHWWIEQLRDSDAPNEAFVIWLQESPLHVQEVILACILEEAFLNPTLRAWRMVSN